MHDPSGKDVIPTAEMCDALAAQLSAIENKQVRFRLEYASNAGSHEPPADGLRPDDLGPGLECSSVIAQGGEKYRYEERYVRTPDSLKELHGQNMVKTWDGTQSRHCTYSATNEPISGAIDPEPAMSHRMDPHGTWQGWAVLQYPERHTYIDLLRSERCSDPRLREDGATEWIFVDEPPRVGEVSLVARRGDAGNPVLQTVMLRVYKEVEGNKEVEGKKEVAVSATIEFASPRMDHGGLAGSFLMTYRHYRDDPKDEFWQIAKIELISVESAEADPTLFRPEYKAPMAVADSRYRISYTLGGNKLNLEGRIVRTHVPMEGDVGDRLEWWVERGTMAPLRPDPTQSPNKSGNGSEHKE